MGVGATVIGINNLIVGAPEHEGGHCEVGQPCGQGGVTLRFAGVCGECCAIAGAGVSAIRRRAALCSAIDALAAMVAIVV